MVSGEPGQQPAMWPTGRGGQWDKQKPAPHCLCPRGGDSGVGDKERKKEKDWHFLSTFGGSDTGPSTCRRTEWHPHSHPCRTVPFCFPGEKTEV